jgi:hypothetical protein
MRSKAYNGEVRSSEKDFETLQLGAFATPDLLLAQRPEGLTAESGLKPVRRVCLPSQMSRLSASAGSQRAKKRCLMTVKVAPSQGRVYRQAARL